MAVGKNIKGITIQLDGDATPLQKALKDVDKASDKTVKELGQINRALKFDEGNTTLLAQKQEVLQEALQASTKRLDALKQAQAQVEAQFRSGQIDASQYREFQREIEKTEGSIRSFRRQIDNIDARLDVQADTSGIDKMKSELKALGAEAKTVGKEIGAGIAAGAAAGTAALGALAAEGNEVATDLAKLNAVLSTLGFDNSDGFFDEILAQSSAITGEMDSTVEAINNLANTPMDRGQLKKTMEYLTGASIQFSDTLKLEGMADGLQETLATGAAIGTFGEYLERSGMNLEDFNAKLGIAQKAGKEVEFVLSTLSKTGAQDFLNSYKQMSGALHENQVAQQNLAVETGKFAETLAPLTTALMGVITKVIEWMNNNPELARLLTVIAAVVSSVAAALLILTPIISTIINLWGLLSKGLGIAKLGLAALTGPVGLVIAGIVALIAIIVIIIKHWDKFKVAILSVGTAIKDGLVSAFQFMADRIKSIFTGLASVITGVWSGIVNNIKSAINFIIKGINTFVGGINKVKVPDWVPKVGGKGINIPKIPMLAKGTDYFKGGMAIVGEAGAELVEMPTGAKVHNNKKTQSMLGGDVVITGNNFTIREEADVMKIARELYSLYEKEKRGR